MPKDFKHNHYWKQLSEFTNMLQTRVSKQCWLEVLGSVVVLDEKAVSDEDVDGVLNLSVLSVYCVGIYIPKSPTKV
jgi:hypothetical protein